ncbi:SET domain-containing protein [Thiolapillus sp.]|uniref:SET domain-containing protein n=1 Tax=Thiolapillus brandeum TaxID=1076588 RepID=A0A831RUZ7_9GAMM|nr:SET domain-containing protein [Thiolapillus sp.]HEC05637.1 SET domain-containing protein [Thiolapillus brandeum]
MSPKELRHRDSELREWVYAASSPLHGTGVHARKPIMAGEYIGSYHGPRATRNGTYVLWVWEQEEKDGEGDWVGCSGRNLLRYLNHSLDCNAEFDGLELFAITDIEKDEEITFYYGDEFEEALKQS